MCLQRNLSLGLDVIVECWGTYNSQIDRLILHVKLTLCFLSESPFTPCQNTVPVGNVKEGLLATCVTDVCQCNLDNVSFSGNENELQGSEINK